MAALPDVPTAAEIEQHVLDLMGIRYTASTIIACATALDDPTILRELARRVDEYRNSDHALHPAVHADFDVVSESRARWRLARSFMVVMADIGLVGNAFESAKAFCNRGQVAHPYFARMQAQGWYAFARLIRNAMIHAGVLHNLPEEAVRWRDLTIDPTMEGTRLQRQGFFTSRVAMELMNEIIDSARAGYPLPEPAAG